jgi:hypothetical protein
MQGEQFLQWQAAEATHQLVQWGRILSQKQVLTILHAITPADVARVVESHANHSQMRTFVFRPGGTAFSGEVYR